MKIIAEDWLSVIVLILCVAGLVATIVLPVQAAPSDPVPECEPINTTGAIIVYRCLPDEGPSYLLNSFGFMVVED